MSTAEEWLARIHTTFGEREVATMREMISVEEALAAHPDSSSLWNLRGDLILLLEAESEEYPRAEVIKSYERAAQEDPTSPEPLESLGYYYDVHTDDLDTAGGYFRKALELEAGANTWIGLARVLAQKGQREEAIRLLSPASCPHAGNQLVREQLAEIESGLWDLSGES